MSHGLSDQASNACMYTTYCVFLAIGSVFGYLRRRKGDFFSIEHSKKGVLLALNFLATGLGSTVLTSYPQAAAMSGLQGVIIYALSTSLPMFIFALLGPIIRKACPDGVVLTEWVRKRYGTSCGTLFSICTVVTVYLFSSSELENLRYGIQMLTKQDGKVPLYIEAAFVAIYLAQGGFGTSFFTDNIQSGTFIILIIISSAAMGANFKIDRSLVGKGNLLGSNVTGWKMLYFMMVESFTNDCLLAGFWLRTFAAENETQLLIGCTLAAFMLFIICSICGVAGLLAVWSGLIDLKDPNLFNDSEYAFFEVLMPMPAWVHGFVLVLLISLSTCTFDSYASSLVTTISNDLFRRRTRVIHMRILTFLMMLPIVALAFASPNILSICDMLAAAIVPVLFLGLSPKFYWLSGFEIIMSFVFGMFAMFGFGCVYTGSVSGGGALMILNNRNGIYSKGWGPFGLFVAAPVGSYIGAAFGFFLRWVYYWCKTKRVNAVFDPDMPHWDHRMDEFFKYRWKQLPKPKTWQFITWFFLKPHGETNDLHGHEEDGTKEGADSIAKDSENDGSSGTLAPTTGETATSTGANVISSGSQTTHTENTKLNAVESSV